MKLLKKISLLLSFAVLATTCAFAVNSNDKADAAGLLKGTPTGYTKASDVNYKKTGKYVHNWGARDEDCTFLTSYAEGFYTGSYTFDQLSAKAGGSSQSNAPQSALYSSLKQMMSSKHTHITSYGETRYQYCYTDCVNNNSSYISSFYSAKQVSGTWDGGATWNREHTWPNSKGDASGEGENDIMMLRPASVSENSSRGNKAYGEGSGYYDPNGEGQNVRGDCARIMLFVYTRWGNTGRMWGSSGVIQNLDVLLRWMEEDPVDTWEMGRNDATQSITGTRNVFVDYPEYAWLLFGRDIPEDMCTPSGIASNGEYVPTPGTSSGTGNSSSEDSSIPEDEMTPTEIVNKLYTLSDGESETGSFTVTGVITALDGWNNPTIVVEGMTNKPVYCYKLVDDRFVIGATITVTATTLKNYEGTYEFMNCTLDSITLPGNTPPVDSSSSSPEQPPVDDSSSSVPDDETGTNITKPAQNVAYNMYLNQANVGKTLYLTGNMDSKYFEMSDDEADAVAVYAEPVNGGYKFYHLSNGSKAYITLTEYQKSNGFYGASVSYSADGTVFYYQAMGCWAATLENDTFFLGTYQTFQTASASASYYMTEDKMGTEQFPLLLVERKAEQPPVEDSSSEVPEDSSSSSYIPEDSSSEIPEDSSSSSYIPEDSSSEKPNSSASSSSSSSSYVPDDSSTPEDSSSQVPDDSFTPEDSSTQTSSDSSKDSSKDSSMTSSEEEKNCDNGHDFDDWVIIKEATETEDGKRMRTCKVCGGAQMETLPKLGSDSSVADSTTESSDNVQSSAEEQSGCESSICAPLASLLLVAGVALLVRKGKKEE